MYLNESPYGGNIYGVEEASQAFFGKPASEVTLAEAAYLASLPKAPTYYSPYGSHKDELINRQRYIINGMVEEGYIAKEEGEAAKNEELAFKPQRENIRAPHFVFFLKEVLAEKGIIFCIGTKYFIKDILFLFPVSIPIYILIKQQSEIAELSQSTLL